MEGRSGGYKRNKERLIVSEAVTRLRVNWIFPFVPFVYPVLPPPVSFFFFKVADKTGKRTANSIEVAIKPPGTGSQLGLGCFVSLRDGRHIYKRFDASQIASDIIIKISWKEINIINRII